MFGPPDYNFKLNKEDQAMAARLCLSTANEGWQNLPRGDIAMDAPPHTRTSLPSSDSLKMNNGKRPYCRWVNKNVILSALACRKVTVSAPIGLNTHDLLNTDALISEDGMTGQLYSTAE
jgi:large subunit ribosomal protein L4